MDIKQKSKKKKNCFVITMIIASVMAIIVGTLQYKYIKQKEKFYQIQDKLNNTLSGGIFDLQGLLTTYFFENGKVVGSMNELVNSITEKVSDNSERSEIENALKHVFMDPWSCDSSLWSIIPVYDRKTGLAVSNLIISSGIDGRNDYCEGRKLFIDDITNQNLFYNKNNFDPSFMLRCDQNSFDFSFWDYLFGEKDFIFLYINYYEILKQQIKLYDRSQVDIQFQGIITCYLKRGEYTSVVTFPLVLSEKYNHCFAGFLLSDSMYNVSGKLMSFSLEKQDCNIGDTIIVKSIIEKIDVEKKTIIVKNGFIFNY